LSARGPSRRQFPKTDLRAAFGSAFVEKSQNAVPPGPSQLPDKIPPKTKIFYSFFKKEALAFAALNPRSRRGDRRVHSLFILS
jgi:hypothetical protein